MYSDQELFIQQEDGVFVPRQPVEHREEEYDSAGFDGLAEMQARHFWYKGRHRFLLHALRGVAGKFAAARRALPAMIDLGGGCGGWVQYLATRPPRVFSELALGDSSACGLSIASRVLSTEVRRYQVDLLCIPWEDRWDVIFVSGRRKPAIYERLKTSHPEKEGVCQVGSPVLNSGGILHGEPAHDGGYSSDLKFA